MLDDATCSANQNYGKQPEEAQLSKLNVSDWSWP